MCVYIAYIYQNTLYVYLWERRNTKWKAKRTWRKSQGKIEVIFYWLKQKENDQEKEWNIYIRIDLTWCNSFLFYMKNVWNVENLPVRDEHKLWKQ